MVINVKPAETAQEVEKFRKNQEMLLDAFAPYGIVRVMKESGEIVVGALRGGETKNPTGRSVFGYTTLLLEDGTCYYIDIMDIRLVKNAASPELVQRFTDRGLIKVVSEEEKERILREIRGI